MTVLAPERNPDEVVGVSSCCPGANLRYSEPCHAAYCERCDTWQSEPKVIPFTLGPTWQRDPETGRFLMPKYTLGPEIAAWVRKYVNSPDGEGGFRFTKEQLRLLYWIYAIDENGRWVYRELTIQRLKGWGKDPFAALLSIIEMVGPCRFSHWGPDGKPVAKVQRSAWVQVMAVAKDQTKNTMKMFGVLVSDRMKAQYGVVVGKEQVMAKQGECTIEAVTSSPETREGNRPTFQIGNEPHHWKENNDGHDMREVMDRNLKQPGARILWITNAYNPSEMSVGQANRESWEDTQGEKAGHIDTGVMYDSLEAPENARMVPREIIPTLLAVRGDSVWVDVEDKKNKILDSRNSVALSRRFYYNQIGADEEAWLDPKDVDATVHPQVAAWRKDPEIDTSTKDAEIKVGWAPVGPDEPIVVFFDGGKSDDHTAISGCRISDGYLFAIGHWGRPAHLRDNEPWLAPRTEVDDRMIEVMDRFRVVALWGDPSHAKDDEDDTPYWDGLLDTWHRRWKDRLQFWAVKTGDGVHSVKWDMTSPARTAQFVQGAMNFVRDMTERVVIHDGHPMFIRYMKNAKAMQSKFGTTLWKGARGSKRKIDGAVTHAGALMLRELFLNREEKEEQAKPAEIWGYRR